LIFKKIITYGVGNPGPVMGQTQIFVRGGWGGVKKVNGIPTLSPLIIQSPITINS
jgi:hypothetical protein